MKQQRNSEGLSFSDRHDSGKLGEVGGAALSFSKRPAIFDQRLPEHNQGYESCQHKSCKTHLNKRETGRVFAKKPSCNNAANS